MLIGAQSAVALVGSELADNEKIVDQRRDAGCSL